MNLDSLIKAVPDFVAFVRRDGQIVKHLGGRGLGDVELGEGLDDRRLDQVWPGPDARLLLQWVRKALSTRSTVAGRLELARGRFDVRVSAEGPDKVLCVIRASSDDLGEADARAPGSSRSLPATIDRRGFLQRFQQSVADAAMRERPLSVGLVFLDGLADVGRSIDFAISEKVTTATLQRLPLPSNDDAARGVNWYVGQLGEALLAVVIEGSTNRDEVRGIATMLNQSLSQPVAIGDAAFTLRPSTGIAILGQDAARPQALLECARAAMNEARRAGAQDVQFYSDTMHLRPTVRLDIERELREAIADDELVLRYVGRHDLASGRLVAIHAYLNWLTPLRGEVPPAQFLPIAENTGLALQLSKWALGRLQRDWSTLRAVAGDDVRLSFGALRHHLLADALVEDMEALAASGAIDPGMMELRIAERTLAALADPEATLGRLAELGAKIVIDEFGRGSTSLARLGQLPIDAIQIDRNFVTALGNEPAAARVCEGVAALAHGFGFHTYAAGVDNERLHDLVLEAGYQQGLGDHYGSLPAIGSASRRMHLTD